MHICHSYFYGVIHIIGKISRKANRGQLEEVAKECGINNLNRAKNRYSTQDHKADNIIDFFAEKRAQNCQQQSA